MVEKAEWNTATHLLTARKREQTEMGLDKKREETPRGSCWLSLCPAPYFPSPPRMAFLCVAISRLIH